MAASSSSDDGKHAGVECLNHPMAPVLERSGTGTGEESSQCELVVTYPSIGDVEADELYPLSTLQREPMVTWGSTYGRHEHLCILAVAHVGAPPAVVDEHLVWLVVDIPGVAPSSAPQSRSHYGLAGNWSAITQGAPIVPYKVPEQATTLSIGLYHQSLEVPLAGSLETMARLGFSTATFLATFSLAPVAEVTNVRAAVDGVEEGPQTLEPEAIGYANGGSLTTASQLEAPRTLTDALVSTAAVWPERGVTIYDSRGDSSLLTFRAMLVQARCTCRGLVASGVAAGASLVLQLPLLADHFVGFWACLLACVKPVTVAIPPSYEDANNAVCAKLRNVWHLLQRPPVMTSAVNAERLGGASLLHDDGGASQLRLLSLEDLATAGVPDTGCEQQCQGDPAALPAPYEGDVAFSQLSSGSTGVPKCIQITHRGVVAHIQGEAQFCGIGSADVQVNFLPVDHVVPILTVHCCDVYHGCQEVQAEAAWALSEPLRWLELVAGHRATRTWAPNFAYKLVADALRQHQPAPSSSRPASTKGRLDLDLSACRYWMNAGEQVTIPVCEDFLDQVECFGVKRSSMQPSFGMAEACTCMTYNNEYDRRAAHRLGRTAFVNLGPPVPGVEIRIADEQNATVAERVTGRFQIRGAVVTPGYFNNPEANEAAFVGDGWFNTGDVGFIKDGCLYLTGREKEIIIVRGANFYCYEVEDVVNALPEVLPTFTAATSAHDPSTGTEGLAIFFVPRSEAQAAAAAEAGSSAVTGDLDALVRSTQRVKVALVRHMGLSPSYIVPLPQQDFPKTTSGKIQRAALARSLAEGAFEARLLQLRRAAEEAPGEAQRSSP